MVSANPASRGRCYALAVVAPPRDSLRSGRMSAESRPGQRQVQPVTNQATLPQSTQPAIRDQQPRRPALGYTETSDPCSAPRLPRRLNPPGSPQDPCSAPRLPRRLNPPGSPQDPCSAPRLPRRLNPPGSPPLRVQPSLPTPRRRLPRQRLSRAARPRLPPSLAP